MDADIFRHVDIRDLKKTQEYKDVEAIKFTEKKNFTEEEVKHVMYTAIMMKIAMVILDKIGLLHNPIMEQAKPYIKPDANKHEFFLEIIKAIEAMQRKSNSIPLARRKYMLDEITKLIAYQNMKHKKKNKDVLRDLVRERNRRNWRRR
uniref:Uncharacterized protein n=1 Tax=Carcinus maenas virus 1 TaxID=2704945 RepID=A0A6G9HDY1_9VIRU|nr:hypothetical protein [Carcinus maenas virus 1]